MSEATGSEVRPTGDLLEDLAADGLTNVSRCFQCKKCTNGCPLTFAMDVMPNQIIRMAQMGLADEAMATHTIWICAACETCTARCPNEIDIAGVMDALRKRASRSDVEPAEAKIPVFHEKFLKSIRKRGRVYEMGLVSAYKMGSGDLWTDMGLGMKMLKKGRLPLLPHRIRGKKDVRAMFDKGEPA
jgi:heterodisulfide reductase subunit C2